MNFPGGGGRNSRFWENVDLPLSNVFLCSSPRAGEDETVWLQEAGLGELAVPFLDGREIAEKELENAVVNYSKPQREAIKKRVKSLNNTLRQRKNKARHRKADVRDVFKDVEVSGRNIIKILIADRIDAHAHNATHPLGY